MGDQGDPAFAMLPAVGKASPDPGPGREYFPDEVASRLIAGEPPLKVFREYRGFSPERLAETAGMALTEIARIEAGGRMEPGSSANRLAAALGLEADDLV